MAPRLKKVTASQGMGKGKSKPTPRGPRGRVPEELVRQLIGEVKDLRVQYSASADAARQFAAVVEDMRAQNRATIEAVLGLRDEMQRNRAVFLERFDRLDNVYLKLSSDVVLLKTDMAQMKTSLARVEDKVEGKADVAALRAVDLRVSGIEAIARSA